MVKRIILIIAITMIALSGVALAADTATVAVSANVTGTCKFINKAGILPFGSLDPASGTDVIVNAAGVTQPTLWCTKGTPYTITDDGGARGTYEMKHATLADLIPYSFTYTPTGTGGGRTVTLTMNIAGQVAWNDFRDASEGSYTDTVTLTIAP
jgi:spore coat protein U-like protein